DNAFWTVFRSSRCCQGPKNMRFLGTAIVALVSLGFLGPTFGQEKPQESRKGFTYKKTKQTDLDMIVHFPPGWKATDKRPGIVFFFAGAWENGPIKASDPQAQSLASRGMVTARADYRVKSRHGVTPKECVEDARSAVRWFRQHAAELGVDPDRIVA